jgi:hypothetical protein
MDQANRNASEDSSCVWVTLRDRDGKPFLRVRIPRTVPPLKILQWGPRFYFRSAHDGDYRETDCFFVTLESQYPQSRDQKLRQQEPPREWSSS